METIGEMYTQFGREVAREVEKILARDQSLAPVLQRFGVHPPTTPMQQHAALKTLLFRHGASFLLNCLRKDMSREEIEVAMVRRLIAASETQGHRTGGEQRLPQAHDTAWGGNRTDATRPLAGGGAGTPDPSPFDSTAEFTRHGGARRWEPPHSIPHSVVPPLVPGMAVHRPPPGPAATQPLAPLGGAGRAWVAVPTYEGPDRRSRPERRVGPADRRATLDVVFRNKRFGGRDRRKFVRRAEDREKMRAKGLDPKPPPPGYPGGDDTTEST